MAVQAGPIAARVGVDYPKTALTHWDSNTDVVVRKKNPKTGKRPFPPYVPSAARIGVRGVVPTGRRTRSGARHILRLQQMTAGGAILDSAGPNRKNTAGASRFIANLDTYSQLGGRSVVGEVRSRVLFKSVKDKQPMVEEVVERAVQITDSIVTKHINR